jgi:hypothetical protein
MLLRPRRTNACRICRTTGSRRRARQRPLQALLRPAPATTGRDPQDPTFDDRLCAAIDQLLSLLVGQLIGADEVLPGDDEDRTIGRRIETLELVVHPLTAASAPEPAGLDHLVRELLEQLTITASFDGAADLGVRPLTIL